MKRGFSLIEVIVAIVVFLILTSGIYSSINALLYKSGRLKFDTQAAVKLAEGLEGAYRYYSTESDWCTTAGVKDLAVGLNGWEIIPLIGSVDGYKFLDGLFYRRIEIDNSTAGKCIVKVDIKWDESSGEKHKIASLTLIKI